MKKNIAIIMLFSVLLCCIGCFAHTSGTTVPDQFNSVLSESETPITDSHTDDEHHEVPFILAFNSFNELAELKNMLVEDEEIIVDYLDDKGFSMNGLSTKNDVVELFERIGDLSMLHLDVSSGYELVGVSYYVTYDYLLSTYKNGEEIVRFICYIGTVGEMNSSSVGSLSTESIGTFSVGDNTVGLHSVEETNSPFALSGNIKTANSQITILLSENDEATIRNSISVNIISSTLMHLIEN